MTPAASPLTVVFGDTAGVITHGVLPHTPINHMVFSEYNTYLESSCTTLNLWSCVAQLGESGPKQFVCLKFCIRHNETALLKQN